jgi:outer membrane protein TolC
MRQARITRTSTEHTRDRVASEVLRDVLSAYWELWYADSAVAIQVQSQAVAAAQRDDARARSESGSLAPADVLTFDTQVATRDEDLVDAQTTRAQRAHELSRLLGTNEHEGFTGELSDEPLSAQAFARDTTEQRALAQSAQIQEQISAVELARVQQKTADDPQKPRLDLDTNIQTQGLGNRSVSDAANQFIGGNVISGLVTLTYEAPLRDRVRRAEAAKARLATEVAEEQLRQLRQQVLSDVRTALDRGAAGQQKVELAERTSGIAERQLYAEQTRYRSGSSTAVAVLEAEDKVRSAKLRLARARADLAQSALTIEHLTGDLLGRYARR